MTFPKEPVPRTSWISYCFFLLAEGGCSITFWETSENMMMAKTILWLFVALILSKIGDRFLRDKS